LRAVTACKAILLCCTFDTEKIDVRKLKSGRHKPPPVVTA
jgi:hypothetical protein